MSKTDLQSKLKEAKKSESSGDYFSAAIHYTNATKIARDLGDKIAITSCKNKIVEMNQKSDFAYKEFASEQEIPLGEINVIVNKILEGSIEEVLKNIGTHSDLLPKIEYIEKTSQETMPVSLQLASLTTISTDGHLLKGGTNANIAWVNKVYSIHQGIITELYLSKIFKGLAEKGLNQKNLLDYFHNTGIFPESNLEIISVGIDRYFATDYVSALHILIPQFENVFLYLSEKLGIDIVSLNRGEEISTQLKTLSDYHLSSKAFQDKWGCNLCEQIKFVLFEQLGYTLRHKIAHGQIDKKECNLSNTNLILYLFIVLSARINKTKS
jgi:hypothetical protein